MNFRQRYAKVRENRSDCKVRVAAFRSDSNRLSTQVLKMLEMDAWRYQQVNRVCVKHCHATKPSMRIRTCFCTFGKCEISNVGWNDSGVGAAIVDIVNTQYCSWRARAGKHRIMHFFSKHIDKRYRRCG